MSRELRADAFVMAILHFLAMENIRDAAILIPAYREEHHLSSPETRMSELAEYLVELCQRDARPLFEELRTLYEDDIKQEETHDKVIKGARV